MKWRKLLKINLLGLPTTGHDDWKLNGLTLTFIGVIRKYEKDFRIDYFNRSLNPFRISLVIAIIFFGLFAFLDALLLPELRNLFWLIRFGIITPVLVSVIFLSFSNAFKKYMQLVISMIMYVTGLAIIVMIIFAANIADHYTYYAGLILIFIFGYTFIKARFVYATIAGWSIVATYEIGAIWLSETPIEVLINNNFFFISANVIGMFINYFMEHSARRDFYMRILLEKEQKKVKTANFLPSLFLIILFTWVRDYFGI